jgi:hypothetical protein
VSVIFFINKNGKSFLVSKNIYIKKLRKTWSCDKNNTGQMNYLMGFGEELPDVWPPWKKITRYLEGNHYAMHTLLTIALAALSLLFIVTL